MAVLRHLLELMLNPFFICLIVLFYSCIVAWRRKSGRTLSMILTFVFLTLLILSTGWVPRAITHALESSYPIIHKAESHIRWVVVLGGGQNNIEGIPVNDKLTSASIRRLLEGIRLMQQLPAARLLLSGGGSVGEHPEALQLKQLALLLGVPEGKIVLESNSLNTADQARELVTLLKREPFYLVTSAIHMPRSMLLCQQQQLNPIAAPTDFTFFWQSESWAKLVVPNAHNLHYCSIAWHELLGRAWAAMAVK